MMKKPRNSTGKFSKTENPKKHLIRVTDEEKQLIEEFRKKKHPLAAQMIEDFKNWKKKRIK